MRSERHNISMLTAFTSSVFNPTNARSAQSRLASPSSESRLSRSEAGTQLTAFSQIPKSSAHASSARRHSHPLVSSPIWDLYFDISEWHILSARAWTPALMLHLTNPCIKRKARYIKGYPSANISHNCLPKLNYCFYKKMFANTIMVEWN